MGNSIFKVGMKWGFSCTAISQVHCRYRESGKTSNLQWLKIINQYYRIATLSQIAADFNVGASTSDSVRKIQRNIIDMDFLAKSPLLYPCWLEDTKLCVSLGPTITNIGMLMTRNMLPGLTSLVSNYIEQMDIYGYEDNLMNS